MKSLVLEIPLRIVSESNAREHWAARARRARSERDSVDWHLAPFQRLRRTLGRSNLPLAVTLVRRAPRALDSDNLAAAFKHVRDAVADFLGCDDGPTSRVEWRYAQEPADTYAVRIEIVLLPHGGAHVSR